MGLQSPAVSQEAFRDEEGDKVITQYQSEKKCISSTNEELQFDIFDVNGGGRAGTGELSWIN